MFGILAVAWGLALGYGAGGSYRNLVRSQLRFEIPIVALFVIQGIFRGRLPFVGATRYAMAVWLASSIVLVALLWWNRHCPGIALAAVGVLLNVVVVAANSSMPVSIDHAGLIGALVPQAIVQSGGFYRLIDSGTIAPFLSDVMPLQFAGATMLLSLGDVALMVAVVVYLVSSMRTAPLEQVR